MTRITLAVVAVALALWMVRYQPIPVNRGGMYILDRWTGSVTWCFGSACGPIGPLPVHDPYKFPDK